MKTARLQSDILREARKMKFEINRRTSYCLNTKQSEIKQQSIEKEGLGITKEVNGTNQCSIRSIIFDP